MGPSNNLGIDKDLSMAHTSLQYCCEAFTKVQERDIEMMEDFDTDQTKESIGRRSIKT